MTPETDRNVSEECEENGGRFSIDNTDGCERIESVATSTSNSTPALGETVLSRRKALVIGSTTAISLLAGCGGGGDETSTPDADTGAGETSGGTDGATTNGDGGRAEQTSGGIDSDELTTSRGPASFSEVALDGPANATVDESVNLSLSVANTGGENGTFAGTLTVKQGANSFNKSVEVGNVAPGKSKNITIDSVNFSAADDYTVGFSSYDATHSVTVDPVVRQLGESYTFTNDLKVTVESIDFQPALFYTEEGDFQQNEEQTALLSAGSEKTLAIVRVSVENVGTDSQRFNTGSDSDSTIIGLEEGTWYEGINGTPLNMANNIEGSPLDSPSLDAGGQTSGWLLGQLPREAATGTVGVIRQRNGGNTPPEVRWEVPPEDGSSRPLPQFSVESFELPDQAKISEGVPYSVTISNQGDGAGTFRGLLRFFTESDQAEATITELSADIEPGNSETLEGTHDWGFLTASTYTLPPSGEEKSVQMQPATPKYGETYLTPGEREITVSEPTLTDTLTEDDEGDLEEYETNTGRQWALAKVKVAIPNSDTSAPDTDKFTLRVGDESFDYDLVPFGFGTYAEPVSGEPYNSVRREVEPGTPVVGYLRFELPDDATLSDIAIQMSVDALGYPPYTARWGGGSQ